MRAFAFRIELNGLVAVDRLQNAHPGELHRSAILCGLGDAGAASLLMERFDSAVYLRQSPAQLCFPDPLSQFVQFG